MTGLPEPRCPECGSVFDPDALLAEARARDQDVILGRAEMIRQARLREVVLVQALMAILFSLILDGGGFLTVYLIAMTAYWSGVVVYVARRATFSSKKQTFIRLGWLPVFALTMIATSVVGYLTR